MVKQYRYALESSTKHFFTANTAVVFDSHRAPEKEPTRLTRQSYTIPRPPKRTSLFFRSVIRTERPGTALILYQCTSVPVHHAFCMRKQFVPKNWYVPKNQLVRDSLTPIRDHQIVYFGRISTVENDTLMCHARSWPILLEAETCLTKSMLSSTLLGVLCISVLAISCGLTNTAKYNRLKLIESESHSNIRGKHFIFIGDSLDRQLVQEQCEKRNVVPYSLQGCLKCKSCDLFDDATKLTNIMLYGTGANNVWHADSTWARETSHHSPVSRVKHFLPHLLTNTSLYRNVIVSFNLFLWDVRAQDLVRFIDGSYAERLYEITSVLRNYFDKHENVRFFWRTSPYNTLSTNVLTRIANTYIRMAACATSVRVIDWASLTANETYENNELKDFAHFKSYDRFFAMHVIEAVGEPPCTKNPVKFNLTSALEDDRHHALKFKVLL